MSSDSNEPTPTDAPAERTADESEAEPESEPDSNEGGGSDDGNGGGGYTSDYTHRERVIHKLLGAAYQMTFMDEYEKACEVAGRAITVWESTRPEDEPPPAPGRILPAGMSLDDGPSDRDGDGDGGGDEPRSEISVGADADLATMDDIERLEQIMHSEHGVIRKMIQEGFEDLEDRLEPRGSQAQDPDADADQPQPQEKPQRHKYSTGLNR